MFNKALNTFLINSGDGNHLHCILKINFLSLPMVFANLIRVIAFIETVLLIALL